MEIHGKKLEMHGEAIYYGNRLIKSESQDINKYTDWDYWVKIISANPNFCACKSSELHNRIPALVCRDKCPSMIKALEDAVSDTTMSK